MTLQNQIEKMILDNFNLMDLCKDQNAFSEYLENCKTCLEKMILDHSININDLENYSNDHYHD